MRARDEKILSEYRKANARHKLRMNKRQALKDLGFTIGPRDLRLNRKYPGAFMVVEAHDESELPTDDGANGPWCIVGDDLAALIDTAFDVWGDDAKIEGNK